MTDLANTSSVDPATLAPTARPEPFHWPALLVLLTGTFMVVLDFFIVNVALPSMQRELRASAGALQFVVAGYGLASAAGLVTGGRLGDIHGQRRMFVAGLALFTLASALCGLAPSASTLIAARVLQGAAAALLQPQVLALIGLLYVDVHRARAFAAYGMALGLGAALGQLIGGLLIQANPAGLGWRSCFLINVPIGALALVLVPRLIPHNPPRGGRHLDLAGAALIGLMLLALTLPLVQGREQGWPAWTWIVLASAPLLAGVFVAQQRRLAARGGEPLIAPALWTQPALLRGLAATLLFYMGNASFYFVLAIYMQQGMRMAPLPSGLLFTTMASGFLTTSLGAAWIARRVGPRSIAFGAALLTCAHLGQAAIALVAPGEFWLMIPLLVLEGAGIGMVMAPLVSEVLKGLPAQFAGVASGILASTQQSGNALGVALIGIPLYASWAPESLRHEQAFAVSLVCLALLAAAVALVLLRQTVAAPIHADF